MLRSGSAIFTPKMRIGNFTYSIKIIKNHKNSDILLIMQLEYKTLIR